MFGLQIIDPRGVAATGFSNGGMLIEEAVARGSTLALGHGHARGRSGGALRGSAGGLFAAIAPVGGHQHPETIPYHRNMSLDSLVPTPIMMVHSADDGLVRFDGCGPGARCCCGIDDAVAKVGRRLGSSRSAVYHAVPRSTTIVQLSTTLCHAVPRSTTIVHARQPSFLTFYFSSTVQPGQVHVSLLSIHHPNQAPAVVDPGRARRPRQRGGRVPDLEQGQPLPRRPGGRRG